MAIPPSAVIWQDSMDPYDVLDFAVDCSALLDTGETITAFTVVPGPEAGLLGLAVNNTSQANKIIYFWTSVGSGYAADSNFSGAGASLPIETSMTTSAGRKYQRTIVLRVAQR